MSDNQNIDTTTNINETDTNKTSTDHSDDYEKICYVCRRPESKAGEMITMPGGMNFCHECMQKAFDSISKSGERSDSHGNGRRSQGGDGCHRVNGFSRHD